jgi:hypothetical protein
MFIAVSSLATLDAHGHHTTSKKRNLLDEGIVQYLRVQERIRLGRKYLSIPSHVQEDICSIVDA